MEGLDKLLTRWSEKYYLEPFYILCEFIALLVGIKVARKDNVGRFFLFYIAFDFTIIIIDLYLLFFSSYSRQQKNTFFNLSNGLISFVELSVYYYFFTRTLKSIRIIKYIKFSYIIFAFFVFLFVTNNLYFLNFDFGYQASLLNVFEFILLLPVCFTYYIEIFNSPVINLFQKPSFWITTGIFFFAVVSTPYSLLSNFLISNKYINYGEISSVFYDLPFGINFLFLTRSFLCKKELTI